MKFITLALCHYCGKIYYKRTLDKNKAVIKRDRKPVRSIHSITCSSPCSQIQNKRTRDLGSLIGELNRNYMKMGVKHEK